MTDSTIAFSPRPTVGPLQFLPLGRIVAEAAEPGEVMTLDDLNTSANWLASEIFEHDLAKAVGHPQEWYRDQWGSNLPEQQAVVLRAMTIEQCEQQSVLARYQAGITDMDVERRLIASGDPDGRERRKRAGEHLDGAGYVFVMIWLFLLANLAIGSSNLPSQAELTAAHAAHVTAVKASR